MVKCGLGELNNTQTGQIISDLWYIAFEYFDGQDLFDFMESISESGEGLGEEAGRFILNQLLQAVKFCHDRGITH